MSEMQAVATALHSAAYESQIASRWQAILSRHFANPLEDFPKVERDEMASFFQGWNQLHEAARGMDRERLKAFARRCAMDTVALHLLNHGVRSEQLQSIALLGNLGEYPAWRILKTFALSDDAELSARASLALVQIHPTKAAAFVVGQIARRTDWRHDAAMNILLTAGAEIMTHHLGVAALYAPNEHAPRLLRLLRIINPDAATEVAHFSLEHTKHPEVVAACLESLNRSN